MTREPSGSFFRGLTKYSSSSRADPRENRLTEAFAAVLREVEGLGLALAIQWLDPGNADRFRGEEAAAGSAEAFERLSGGRAPVLRQVRTQQLELLPERRWIDLELLFDAGGHELKVRIEVKHGSKPENGQVPSYRLDEAGNPAVPVVLLAPSRDLPFTDTDQAPEDVPQRSWQSTLKTIERFKQKTPAPVAAWILGHFIEFAREEGLMPMDAITEEEAGMVSALSTTTQALRELLESARIEIGRQWGEKDPEKSSGGKGVGAWKHYRMAQRNRNEPPWLDSEAWFEFKVSDDVDLPSAGIKPGEVVFIAGLTWDKPSGIYPGPLSERLTTELTNRQEGAFAEFREHGYDRLMRAWSVSDLVNRGTTLEEQGVYLGAEVVAAFEELSASSQALHP